MENFEREIAELKSRLLSQFDELYYSVRYKLNELKREISNEESEDKE